MQHMVHKVRPRTQVAQSPVDLLPCILEMCLPLHQRAAREDIPKGSSRIRSQARSLLHDPDNHVALDRLEHIANPRMKGRLFQTLERFAKRQIADEVESRPVEPLDNIDRVFGAGRPFQPVHQHVYVALQQGLLLAQGPVREPIRKEPPIMAVLLAGGIYEVWRVGVGNLPFGVLGHFGLAGFFVAVDVFPCLCGDVGYFVGGDSHDWAVLPMEVSDGGMVSAADQGRDRGSDWRLAAWGRGSWPGDETVCCIRQRQGDKLVPVAVNNVFDEAITGDMLYHYG